MLQPFVTKSVGVILTDKLLSESDDTDLDVVTPGGLGTSSAFFHGVTDDATELMRCIQSHAMYVPQCLCPVSPLKISVWCRVMSVQCQYHNS